MLAGHGLAMPALRKDLTAVAAAMGPGRYARLRAGVAFAKGLATGWGVPFVGVRSAAAVAHAAGGRAGPIVQFRLGVAASIARLVSRVRRSAPQSIRARSSTALDPEPRSPVTSTT